MIDFQTEHAKGEGKVKVYTTFSHDGIAAARVARIDTKPITGKKTEIQRMEIFTNRGFSLLEIIPIMIDYGLDIFAPGNSWQENKKLSNSNTMVFDREFEHVCERGICDHA